MSETDSPLPTLTFDPNFWVDLEVPCGMVIKKWQDRYEDELKERLEEGLIHDRILDFYFELTDDLLRPDDPVVAFEELVDHDEQFGYNLRAQHDFVYQKNTSIVKDCARESIFRAVDGSSLRSLYHDAYEAGDKITLVALIQLFEPSVLRNILGLNYCYGKSPRSVGESDTEVNFDVQSSVDEIIKGLSRGQYLEYSRWHSFEHQNKEYVMIKRQIDDSVERQPTQNQEEEPAEFIVLKFLEEELQVFTKRKTIAERARNSVNQTSEDAEFDIPSAAVDHHEAEESVDRLLSDGETLSESPVTTTGLKLDSSPLPNQPSITMKTDIGIIDTLEALDQRGYDLTESISDIQTIYLDFEGREYRVFPEEQEQTDDEYVWVFRYNAGYLTDEERNEFESAIGELIDIDVVFENA